MLVLNDKKIRKGKPIGLPYIGSKKKISKKIVQVIIDNFGADKPIYDVFGGGGAIAAECLLHGLDVHYNDLNSDITDCFKRVIEADREYFKTLIVSRDEFFKIKNKETKTVDDNLKLLINSFGNNKESYLYAKDIADFKYNLAKEIIENHDCFGGYKQTSTYTQTVYNSDLQQLQQLRQLEQVQRLQMLENMQQVDLSERLKITNKDYKAFSEVENAIFYLDPPYEDTWKYYSERKASKLDKNKYKETRDYLLTQPQGTEVVVDGFKCFLGQHANNRNRMYVNSVLTIDGSKDFYDWAFEMAKKNIVLISSYKISDKRFKEVFKFDTARSTLNSGTHKDETKAEKLFMADFQT